MKMYTVMAAFAAVLCLFACGVQTTDDDSDNPASRDPVAFGGVGNGHGQQGANAAPSNNSGGPAPANTGNTQTDGGSNATDSGSPVVDSGSDAMADAGSPDSGIDSGKPDAGSDAAVDSGTPDSGVVDSGVVVPDNADVIRLSNGGKTFLISTRYIFSANCGEVRGPMPGVGWSSSPLLCDMDNDGYLAYTPIAGTVGTFAFTYTDPTKGDNGWALYGNIDVLRGMSPTARSFVECTWWNASTQTTTGVGTCSLKATFGSGGMLVGAGNMANLL